MGDYVLWFLLGVVIFVLAIVGFVRVLQLLFAGTKPRFLPQRCRNCEQPLHTLTGRCPGCSLRIADANQLADLRSTQRQLSQLRFEGVVNEEMYHELVWHIRQKQRGILHPEARRPTIPEAIVERPPAPPLPSEAIMDVLPVEPEPPRIPPVVESTPSAARERVIAPARQAENIPAPPSPPQARPRRSLGMWLAAFMEERNILWGELTGGLLMVGCSIALVLSLWKTLEQIPLFPFIILAAITSLLLAVGRYTLHHWKLEATSRGLLVIALLLVPLNFLVLAGLSPKATGSPIELGIKAAGIALFAVLATLATADLFPETATVRKAWRDSRFLALAVLGISVCPLAVPRLFQIGLAPENILLGLTLVPVALHAATIGLMLRRRWMEDNGESPLPALGFTGLASFPLALTFGFNILWTHSQHGSIEFLLQRFSILLAMAGTPLLASGLFVQRRASGSSALAGTLVALVGGLVQFAAIVLAWPDPLLLLAVASVNAIVWTAAAFLYRFPLAHAMAITNFVAGGWIAGQLLLNGTALPELDFHALGTGSSGVTFSILAAALVLAADMLRQRAAWNHGRFHALGAGVAAGLSLVLVSAHAIREPERAALVGLATAAGCLLLEWRWRITWLGQAGSLLLPAASLAALHWLWPAHPEFWGPMLAGEALLFGLLPRNWRPSMVLASFLAVGAAVISVASGFAAAESIGHTLTAVILSVTAMTQAYRLREAGLAWIGSLLLLVGLGHAMFVVPGLRPPMSAVFLFLAHAVILLPFLFVQHRERFAAMAEALCRSAQITSILASVVLLFHITPGHLVPLMIASTVLAMLWLLFALSERSQGWLMLLQVASSALVIFTMAKLRGTTEADLGFSKAFDFYGLGLAGLIAAWTGLRLWLPANELLRSRWPALERIVLGLLITATITLIVFEAPPAIMRELSPANRFDEAWLERGPRFFSALPGGAWLLLATLAAALVSNSWLVRSRSGQTLLLLGFLALATAAPVLASQAWLESRASASSLRWGLAIVFAVSCPLFWFRQSLEKLAARLGIRLEREDWAFGSPAAFLRGISVFVIAGIPLAITLLTMAMLLTGNVPAGPRLDSAFRTMGIVASHGIPLGLIMAGLAGHAVRERQPRYAFAGGLIGQLLVCGGFAVGVATRQEPFTSTVWTQLLLRSAITAAVWAGGWLPVAAWLGRFRDSTPARSRTLPSTWWNGQIAQSAIALGLLLGVVAFALIVPVSATGDEPPPLYQPVPNWMAPVSGWLGWTALGLTVAALAGRGWLAGERRWGLMAGFTCLATVILIAPRMPPETAWPFRTLLLGWAGCSWTWSLISSRKEEESDQPQIWAGATALIVLVLAGIAALWQHDRLWPAVALLLVSSSEIWLARLRRRDDWAFVGGLGVNLATSLIVWHFFDGRPLQQWVVYLLEANAFAAAGAALLWSGLRRQFADVPSPVPFLQHALAIAFLAAAIVPATLFILFSNGNAMPASLLPAGNWTAWLTLATVVLAAGIWLRRQQPEHLHLVWGGAALLTGATAACTAARFDAGTGFAFRVLLVAWAVLSVFLFALKSKDRSKWAVLFACLLLAMSLRDSLFGPAQPLVAALGMGIFAVVILVVADLEERQVWKYAGFSLAVVALAEVGFARVDPNSAAPWLHHTVALLAALTVATIGYSFGVARLLDRSSRWAGAARQMGPVLGLIAAGVVVLAIAQEGLHFDQVTKKTPLAPFETGIVLAAICGLMVAGIAFAVKPWIDPFGLPERGRKFYVYAAELLLVLLFLHVRFNVPGLFPKMPATIWPFLVMAIAFVGVGLSELFRRIQMPVLSEPLQRTGVFLPLLPLLMFWLKPPAAIREPLEHLVPGLAPLMKYFDSMPHHFGSYALLWFLVGLLYAWLAVTKRSYRYALIAALSANAGLWALWTQHDLSFFVHPQLWLVPLALIVLASEWYHRQDLRVEVSAGLRWLGLGLLYLSSTADLFITGLGHSTVLPLALAVLAVLGVLLGILLRIRSYLFLGAGFLALDVFSMIWHAAVDLEQTWIWWACGFLLGAAIVALFALFEKRRPQMLHMMEEMRTWE